MPTLKKQKKDTQSISRFVVTKRHLPVMMDMVMQMFREYSGPMESEDIQLMWFEALQRFLESKGLKQRFKVKRNAHI